MDTCMLEMINKAADGISYSDILNMFKFVSDGQLADLLEYKEAISIDLINHLYGLYAIGGIDFQTLTYRYDGKLYDIQPSLFVQLIVYWSLLDTGEEGTLEQVNKISKKVFEQLSEFIRDLKKSENVH